MIGGIAAISGQQNYYLSVYKAQGAGNGVHAVTTRASSPETPVQPVTPVDAVPEAQAAADQNDLIRQWQYDAGSIAGRSRIEYLGDETIARLRGEAGHLEDRIDALDKEAEEANAPKSAREVMEEGECQTCKERKYQDGSDDPGVSFKTASHIDPNMAASAVRGHEMEHVVRERADAARNNRRVISQYVSYRTAFCPECGKAYVAGGTTSTTTAAKPETEASENEGAQRKSFSALC